MLNLWDLFKTSYNLTDSNRGLFYFENVELTWGDVNQRSLAIATQLKSLGLKKTDTVAIFLDHSPSQAISLFGVSSAGGIFTLVPNGLKEGQIKNQLSDSQARFLITTEKKLKTLGTYPQDAGIMIVIVDNSGIVFSQKNGNPIGEQSLAIPTDVACFIYTSGSTGRAKGVVIPHRTLLDGAKIVSSYLEIGEEDRLIQMLPLSFDYGLNQMLTVILKRARLYFYNYLFPGELLEFLKDNKITGLATVPSVWPNLFNKRLVDLEKFKGKLSLKYITTAGGFHPLKLLQELNSFFNGTKIFVMYGLTESFRSSFLDPTYLLEKPGSIGKAVPGVELRIVNSKGEECGPREKGELIHRGNFVNYGYLNNEVLTNQKYIPIRTGGPGCLPEYAVRSGDLCSKDEQGFIYFHGRLDSQIKVKGYRVSPGEIEEYVLSFKDIKSAVCFSVFPYDEVVDQKIALVLTSFSGDPIDFPELKSFIRKTVPSYAVPQVIKQVNEMPLNSNGKISTSLLREEILSEI